MQTTEKNKEIFYENQTELLQPHLKMTQHAMMRTSGPWNPESNCSCREKNQDYNGMQCWRKISTTIGMLMEIENCRGMCSCGSGSRKGLTSRFPHRRSEGVLTRSRMTRLTVGACTVSELWNSTSMQVQSQPLRGVRFGLR